MIPILWLFTSQIATPRLRKAINLLNIIGKEIYWNNDPLPLRYVNMQSDKFLCDGNECDKHFINLPEHIESRFPMRGTKEILSNPMTANTLYLPHAMISYLFFQTAANATHPQGNWANTGHYGDFLGDGSNWRIFKQVMEPGIHIIDSQEQVLLFTKSGKT